GRGIFRPRMIELRAAVLVRQRHDRQREGCCQNRGCCPAVHVRVLLRVTTGGIAGPERIISLRAGWLKRPGTESRTDTRPSKEPGHARPFVSGCLYGAVAARWYDGRAQLSESL